MDPRTPQQRPVERLSHARFRCGTCARFVQANAFGVCPTCSQEPAHARPISPGPLDMKVWKKVTMKMEREWTVTPSLSLIALAVTALVVSVTAALL